MSSLDPVSTETTHQKYALVTVATYPDGSIAVTTAPDTELIAQDTRNGVMPRSIYNGVYSSGGTYAGYWKNCTADVNVGTLRMGFTFDYQKVNGQGASITGYRNGYHSAIGGSMSGLTFSRHNSAAVRYTGTFTAFNGWFSTTSWMQANVNMNGAWTTNN